MPATRQPAFIAPVEARGKPSTESPLSKWILLSAALHLSFAAAFVVWKGIAPPARPPVYRVQLLGAAGPKPQAGVVAEKPEVAPPAPKPAEAPKANERPPETVKKPPPPKKTAEKPVPKPQVATPNATPTKPAAKPDPAAATAKPALPTAGSGSTKARGTDVTTLVQDGIDFPYPVYLNNMIRQIAIEFGVQNLRLTAEFSFLIHRDGSVSEIKLLKSSGRSSFDLDARGAIEAVGNSRKFGPLPSGFTDDVLPVYYTFTPP